MHCADQESPRETSTSSWRHRLASVRALLGSVLALLTSVTAGRSVCESFATLGQDGSWLKTSQGYYPFLLGRSLEQYSESWPKWGMMLDGVCTEPLTSERRTSATASALWPTARSQSATGASKTISRQGSDDLQTAVMWPTPTVPNGGRTLHHVDDWRGNSAYHKGKKVQVDLNHAVKAWAAPKARDYRTGISRGAKEDWGRDLNNQTGGQLNPAWVSCLMGYPDGWLSNDGPPAAESPSTAGSRPAQSKV